MRIAIAGKAVAMNPLEFPELYFYYAVAELRSKNIFDLAEANARRATELDSAHEIPRAEVFAGIRSDRQGRPLRRAATFQKYLENRAEGAGRRSDKASHRRAGSPRGCEVADRGRTLFALDFVHEPAAWMVV